MRVQGLGFGIRDLGFRVWGLRGAQGGEEEGEMGEGRKCEGAVRGGTPCSVCALGFRGSD